MVKKQHRSRKAESLAENTELGLERSQEMFDVIFATLREHNIDEQLWLKEYFDACGNIDQVLAGRQTAKPPLDFQKFLPWNMPQDMRRRLQKRSIAHL